MIYARDNEKKNYFFLKMKKYQKRYKSGKKSNQNKNELFPKYFQEKTSFPTTVFTQVE